MNIPNNRLFLCFYADGPLWDNVVLTPAYPSGYSYFRPFRYRDQWIQSGVLEELKQGLIKSSASAVLCMRFIAEPCKQKILPIREVTITHCDNVTDSRSIYFRLGNFFSLSEINEIAAACSEIPSAEYEMIGNTLFFRSALAVSNRLVADNDEDNHWVKYVNLVATEKILPIKDEAKKAIFLRLHKPNSEAAKIDRIHTSLREGEKYGAVLNEGSAYELELLHRAPSLINRNITPQEKYLAYKTSITGNIELARTVEELSGNYQSHVLTITALQPSGTWEEIIVSPSHKTQPSNASEITIIDLPIPIKVKWRFLYRLKTSYAWLILLWLAMWLNSYTAAGKDARSPVFLAFTSAVTAFLIFLIKEKKTIK